MKLEHAYSLPLDDCLRCLRIERGPGVFQSSVDLHVFFSKIISSFGKVYQGYGLLCKEYKKQTKKKKEQTKTTITTSQGNLLIDLFH